MNPYRNPMQPFLGLERWARRVQLPRSRMELYLYDTAAPAPQSPLLLVHGLGDEADTWRHVLPKVMGNHRVLAPDLPGFGRSDQGRRRYTIPFFVDTLLELLDTLAIERAVLVGHSTGAVIAHSLALAHPERVERLILIGGSLVMKESPISLGLLLFLIPGLGEWAYSRLRKDPQAAYRTLEPYYARLEDLPQADRDFLFQRVNERVWSDGQRRGFLSTLRNLAGWSGTQQKGLVERLQTSRVETLLLWGEHDRVNPPANGRALVELLPSARLEIVAGAGHNLQQEQPDAVLRAIQQHSGAG